MFRPAPQLFGPGRSTLGALAVADVHRTDGGPPIRAPTLTSCSPAARPSCRALAASVTLSATLAPMLGGRSLSTYAVNYPAIQTS